jgi:hypothetical protein
VMILSRHLINTGWINESKAHLEKSGLLKIDHFYGDYVLILPTICR